MGWKEFIASFAENLAWPVAVLAMFLLLRDQIGKLIGKIAHLKYKDLEVDFDKLRKQAEAIQTVSPPEPAVEKEPEEEQIYSSLEEQILELVEKAPSASILLAWSALETSISSAVARLAISPDSPSYRSPLHNIEMLEKHGELPKGQIRLLHEMRMLRNKVAHEHDTMLAISEQQARDYATTALEMMVVLNRLERRGKVYQVPKGNWTHVPDGFVEVSSKGARYWEYSEISIPGTRITAGLGPWKRTEARDGGYECYSIDVEIPEGRGSRPIAELTFSLDHVSADALRKTARDLITYDEANREITFDLGKSVFKYQLS